MQSIDHSFHKTTVMIFLSLCTAADCGSLTNPANGSVSLTMTTFGSMASYSCSERSNLLGDAVRTCQADGMWNGIAPVCGK